MAKTNDDGGQAYPDDCNGMTLLDYFAGQALEGLVRAAAFNQAGEEMMKANGIKPGDETDRFLAMLAYDFGEAMVLEKRKREGGMPGELSVTPPAGPNERAVTHWAEEGARKIFPYRATPSKETERLIQDAIDGALSEARETIVVKALPKLRKIGQFQARNSIDEVIKILSSI